MPSSDLKRLPWTVWAHLIFRYCLNVGVVKIDLNIVFEVDFDESRGKVPYSKDGLFS